MRVREVMSSPVITVSPDKRLKEVPSSSLLARVVPGVVAVQLHEE